MCNENLYPLIYIYITAYYIFNSFIFTSPTGGHNCKVTKVTENDIPIQFVCFFQMQFLFSFCTGETNGPMSVLHDCMKHGVKAKVWVRRYKGLRGCLTGYIAAYDHHMNLVKSS